MNRYILYFFSLIFIATTIGSIFNLKIQVVSASDQRLENTQAELDILQTEYDQLQKEIATLEKQKEGQKGKTTSIDRDISILKTKIKKAQIDIKVKNLLIKNLGEKVAQKDKTTTVLNERIDNIKEYLSELIRKEREIDEKSILTLILSKDTIAEAYGDIDAFASIKKDISDQVSEIKKVKALTEDEKLKLEQTKNTEEEYQKILNDKAKRRAEILSMLFELRDASAIPFEKALEYATDSSLVTNVTPAFILAIITQESNLGTNQGSCYVTNMNTGIGASSKSGKVFSNVMKPSRDIKPFFEIATSVGRDPYKTLVSCPIASAGSSSWGGAMGPAQFIPSTWQGIKNRVANALGIKTPDPWYAKDAFMAGALFLKDLGGVGNNYTAQIKAACKYYGSGGTSCSYGKQVMERVINIQTTMIDPLQD